MSGAGEQADAGSYPVVDISYETRRLAFCLVAWGIATSILFTALFLWTKRTIRCRGMSEPEYVQKFIYKGRRYTPVVQDDAGGEPEPSPPCAAGGVLSASLT